MRVLLAELAPELGDVNANLSRVEEVVGTGLADIAVFPELFLSGYRVGDRVHQLSVGPGGEAHRRLVQLARRSRTAVVVGAPVPSPDRHGETFNAAILFRPDGSHSVQPKRFLPTFGPFEEGAIFAPSNTSRAAPVAGASVGLQICYDLFFPEVSRDLALQGAELLVAISAAPVTSRRLFERILPARAIENAAPVIYVNRVGAEDGIVFGGGSAALDSRGEVVKGERLDGGPRAPEERVELVEIDLAAAARWRPFRPVLRDVARSTSMGNETGAAG